jgi:soluble lytic murein transglycosylase-like protein
VVLAAMTLASGAAVAHERPSTPRAQTATVVGKLERGDRGPAVATLQRKLDIQADGAFGPVTQRAVKRFQRRQDLAVDGIVGPVTAQALGLDVSPSDSDRGLARTGGESSTTLDRIARCESGGDPRAVSPTGRYRGKYQFSRATWRSVGGSGDPARASEAEQDRRAAKLLAQRGTAPWPNCA